VTVAHGHATTGGGSTALLAVALLAAGGVFVLGVRRARRRGHPWPGHRTALWLVGTGAAVAALVGPLAELAHTDPRAHMVGHVLLGMAAPLLMVRAAPVTLALRALPVRQAHALARALASGPVAVLSHPVTAALLATGGLWVLYRTGLHDATLHTPLLHTAVHVHVFLAGYLFTASLVGPDPAPHRPRPGVRATVLVLAVAAHNVLATFLVADPPPGIDPGRAEVAAQVMYYGGFPVELALFVLLGREWAARDRRRHGAGPPSPQVSPSGGR
jgi:putative membrane protein